MTDQSTAEASQAANDGADTQKSDAALPPAPGPRLRAWILFMLVIVYTFNFLDRQILSILKEPIKAELDLTDSDLGILGGWAFALFYAGVGIPVAYLADRTNRTWIMTIALTLWSGMTALCGLAQNYLQLFFARVGVGVGEAGGVAPAYSLIADYYPPEKRSRALSIYSFGIPIGSALGIILGGILSEIIGWRTAFIVVGLMGVAVAPLFKLTVPEPVRGRFDGPKASVKPAPFKAVVKTLLKKPAFWTMSFGAASSSMMGYALIFWLPSYFYRSFGDALPGFFSWMPGFLIPENPSELLFAAYFFGAILLVGGIAGIWLGGVLADRFGQDNKAAYALIPGVAFSLTVPFFLVGALTNNTLIVFFAFLIVQTLALVWLGPVLSAFQQLVGPNMRATASAVFLFINNLIGIGLGTWAMGWLSDLYQPAFGDESLRYSLLTGTVLYVLAAILMFITAPRLAKDWHKEEDDEPKEDAKPSVA